MVPNPQPQFYFGEPAKAIPETIKKSNVLVSKTFFILNSPLILFHL
jgi:hypothetical protein